MSATVSSLITACQWSPSRLLIFSDNVYGPLIYYSHLGVIIPTLLISIFIYLNGRKEFANILLLISVLFFSLWIYADLVLWATESPALVMFFWALEIIVEPLVYFFAFYFFYVFVFKEDFSKKQKILFAAPLLVTFILSSTKLALIGYDLSNCDRAAVEGVLGTYGYVIELLYALLIIGYTVYVLVKDAASRSRLQTVFLAVGITAFLLSFSAGNIVEVFTEDWSIGQYGLFGAPVFVALLAYLIVRFKAFNIRLIGAQALVAALWFLILALLFIQKIENIRTVVSLTLIFVLIVGIALVRSVQREIQQRERIELLAKDLELSNKQQVALIHFITHQLKGFVSKSRNIFAMIQEGDYGSVPETMKPMIDEGFNSSTKGAQTIQEILNAANIKSGKVTYTMVTFDLSTLVRGIVNSLKPNADAKNVALTLSMPETPIMFTGDQMQLENALKNLVDNTIKYTPSGSIAVSLEEDAEHIRFSTKDTGVGITADDMQHLFMEGGHGAESTKVNVDSTGFGLYIVKNIIEGHGGSVRAESEGAGKGSTFTVELPKK